MPNDISLIPAIGVSSSGLDVQNRRMEVIANNVANANSTRGEDGRVFRRKEVVFAAKMAQAMGLPGTDSSRGGVKIDSIVEDGSALKSVYKPGHPDADAKGYVLMPNVEPIEEMIDMMNATRAYEANLAAIKAAKAMASQALQIGR